MSARSRAAFKQARAMSVPRLFAFPGRGALSKWDVCERRVAGLIGRVVRALPHPAMLLLSFFSGVVRPENCRTR